MHTTRRRKRLNPVLASLVFAFAIALVLTHPSQADWTIAFDGSYEYDYGYGSRTYREVRDGTDLDDWIERGNSSVTASPIFADGVRLTGWETGTEGGQYDFALASAIYLFDIPKNSRYIKIKIRYSGEGGRSDMEGYDDVAGRVWIKNYESRRTKYLDEDENEAEHGDTFVLRARRRLESIRIPAANHLDRGILEIHLVVEGSNRLDVESVEVESYQRMPDIRVIRRYDRNYYWRPWNYYTYSYFYDGPSYYFTDYDYYISWTLPRYDSAYVEIHRHYGNYLTRYYELYPNRHAHIHQHLYDDRPNVLRSWTIDHEKTRKLYDRSRIEKRPRGEYYQVNAEVRAQVITALENQRQNPVVSERSYKRTYQGRLQNYDSSGSSEARQSTLPKYRSRVDSTHQSSRSDIDSSSRIDRYKHREELLKKRYETYRTSPTPDSSRYETRSAPAIPQTQRSVEKKRREDTSSSQSSSVNRARSSSSSSSSSSVDDDDEEKKKSSSSSSSSDDSSRSSTRDRAKKRRE